MKAKHHHLSESLTASLTASYFVVIRYAAVFGAAVGEHAQQGNSLLFKKRQHPVVEHIGSRDGMLAVIVSMIVCYIFSTFTTLASLSVFSLRKYIPFAQLLSGMTYFREEDDGSK